MSLENSVSVRENLVGCLKLGVFERLVRATVVRLRTCVSVVTGSTNWGKWRPDGGGTAGRRRKGAVRMKRVLLVVCFGGLVYDGLVGDFASITGPYRPRHDL